MTAGCLKALPLSAMQCLSTRAATPRFGNLRESQSARNAHVIVGEHKTIEQFWKFYAGGGQPPRLLCREILFEQYQSRPPTYPVSNLRAATIEDLPKVLPVHAAMAFEESGIDPLQVDPNGFRMRCRRRIEQRRVWVWIERG